MILILGHIHKTQAFLLELLREHITFFTYAMRLVGSHFNTQSRY